MATESIHEQIVVALRTLLAGIVSDAGVTYWYTPDLVERAADFYEACLNEGLTTIYCLSPDDEDDSFRDSARSVKSVMKVDLVVATRFLGPENPLDQPDPDRWKLQSRLIHDAKKKIRSDYRLGGLCLWMEIPTTDRSAERTYKEGWAIARMRIHIHYQYADTVP